MYSKMNATACIVKVHNGTRIPTDLLSSVALLEKKKGYKFTSQKTEQYNSVAPSIWTMKVLQVNK